MELTDKLSSYLKLSSIDPRAVHSLSLKLGCLLPSIFLSNNLLNAYASASNIVDARNLFDEIPHPNEVSWSAVISCYTQLGYLKDALSLFRALQCSGSFPSRFAIGNIITCCARAKDARIGMQVHCSMFKLGFEMDGFMACALIDMYAKCGRIGDSWRVFDQIPERDVVCWTSMITGLANSTLCQYRNAAFLLFRDMVCEGVSPVNLTFTSLYKIFDDPANINQAKQAHGHMVKVGCEMDDQLGCALLAMYGRCGGVDEVLRLSLMMNHDVVSLTSLLVAYLHNGYNKAAIALFQRMAQATAMIDGFVIASIIGACSSMRDARKGKEIHGYALRTDFLSDVSVGNSLISLYGRCAEISMSEQVFSMMVDKDIISWTAILTCYSQNDHSKEAVSFFRQMLREGLRPPVFSVTGTIRACSQLGDIPFAGQIYARTIRMGIDTHLSVANSVITMYAKCGNIEYASRVFALYN